MVCVLEIQVRLNLKVMVQVVWQSKFQDNITFRLWYGYCSLHLTRFREQKVEQKDLRNVQFGEEMNLNPLKSCLEMCSLARKGV